jgi:hypothetical protein
MKFIRLLSLGLSLCAFAVSGAFGQGANGRTLELVSYGPPVGEVRIIAGSGAATVQVGALPTGRGVAIGAGARIELRQKSPGPQGGEIWTRVADVELPAEARELLAVMVPLREPDATGARYRVVVLPFAARHEPGSYTLANLTPVPVTVQAGTGETPVEIAAWTQRVFRPKTDNKFRALLNVAYRTPGGEWVPVRSGVVVLAPDQATYGRVVVSPQGVQELGGGSTSDAARPTVLILETKRPARF